MMMTMAIAVAVPSDGAAEDKFGESVAIHEGTIVIGSRWDDTENGENSGSAYVYTQNGTVWTKQAKLLPSDGAAEDIFSTSVAIHGDTIVIGDIGHDTDSGVGSGSAYVYTYDGTVWTEQAKLTASNGALGDVFGRSVAINGTTIVIGAPGPFSLSENGQVYVYTRYGTVWTEQAKLTANEATGDQFGSSVEIDAETIVIGAPTDDTENGDISGSAYVYTHSGTVWIEQKKLTASDGAARDLFGRSVAIDGDTIVIGAHYHDTEKGEDSGSAYVYTRIGTVWTEQVKLMAIDAAAKDRFGESVAIDGDTIVIGADGDDGINTGSAYILN